MTERARAHVHRTPSTLAIGPSAWSWDGDGLVLRIDETTVPLPSRIRGTVRVRPAALSGRVFTLDGRGDHRWWPIAPCARVEVALERPALRWSGAGYLDANAGDAPLEHGFVRWDWSRASLDGRTVVLYDVRRRDGEDLALALAFDARGGVRPIEAPARVHLPATRWRIERATRADHDHPASVLETLEDTPFYARSVLGTRLLGAPATAVHESLDLDRFRAGWVQLLLPFRMPRRR